MEDMTVNLGNSFATMGHLGGGRITLLVTNCPTQFKTMGYNTTYKMSDLTLHAG